MGDAQAAAVENGSNNVSVSPAEKQYLDDLAKATRLSLECYEEEQQLRKYSGLNLGVDDNHGLDEPDVGFGRRLSQPDGTTLNDAKHTSRQVLDLKPRPRPFARGTSSSTEGSIISPPPANFISPLSGTGGTIQPPPTAFKRQRSLPYRHRHPNYPLQPSSLSPSSASPGNVSTTQAASPGLGFDPITNSSSSSSFTNNNNTPSASTNPSNRNSNTNSNNDDLISLASPKVTPKFDKSNGGGAAANLLSFCDNLYSTPVDDTSLCLYAPSSTSCGSVMSQRSLSHSPSPSPLTPFAGANNRPILSTSSTPSPFTPFTNSNGYPPYRFPNNPNVPTLPNTSSPAIRFPGSTSPAVGNMLNALNRSNLYHSPSPSPSYSSPMQSYLNNGPRSITAGPSPVSNVSNSMLPNSSKNSSPFSPTNGQPSFGPSSQKPSGQRTSLYQGVFDQLKSISTGEDLIDLGNPDSKNILEYFDPLVIREKWAEDQEQKRIKQEQLEKEKQRQELAQQAKESDYDNAGAASVQSYGSTATTAFSYRPGTAPSTTTHTLERHGSQSMSLYPSLDEFLGPSNGRHDDPSTFYDAYNPFEYLYTVSCSSPSATSIYETLGASNQLTYENGVRRSLGFSHFFSQHPTPVLPPALPPRNSMDSSSPSRPSSPQPSTSSAKQNDPKIMLRIKSITHDKAKRSGKLYENIESIRHFASTDNEVQAFYEMVRELRFSRRHVDTSTNKGYIKSPTIESKCCTKGLSLRIIVWPEAIGSVASASASEPVTFTCDVSSTVDMVIEQSIVELGVDGSARDYIFRVKGWNEYLDADIPLADYQFIQHNIKLDQDIQLVIVARSALGKDSWARTPRDDGNSVNIQIDDILPEVQCKTIDHSQLCIPLEIIEREAERIKETLSNQYFGNNNGKADLEPPHLNPSMFVQPVKAVCVLLGEVVTVELVHCLDFFVKTCEDWNTKTKAASPTGERSFLDSDSRRRTKVGGDVNSRLSYVEIVPLPLQRRNSAEETLKDAVLGAIDRVREAVRTLVEMYSKSFPVSFRMKEIPDKTRPESKPESLQMSDMLETFLVKVGAAHRLKPEWLATYTHYLLTAEVFHGTRWLGKVASSAVNVTKSDNHWFFNTIVFDTWLNFEHMPVCILARESRIVFTLYGRKPQEEGIRDQKPLLTTVELGWTSTQLFNFKGLMAQGNYLLPLWPVGLVQKRLGPAPNSSFSADGQAPLLTIEFSDFGCDLYFPEVPQALPISRDIQTLDNNSQVILKDIVQDNTFTRYPAEDREVLWEKRHYLYAYPTALPKILLVAQLWDWASLGELHALLHHWTPLEPIDAFQLLLPCFPDSKVREQGIQWISGMGDEELINLLPQLVEALSYETFDLSPLARFLLSKSLSSLPISHHLFWLLVSQVGLGKWAKEFEPDHIVSKLPALPTENTYDPKRRRLELMLNSLMVMSGEKWKHALFAQYKMIESMAGIAAQVKAAKDSARTTVLTNELRKLSANIFDSGESYPLPVSPSALVNAVDMKACSYFNSNALPLKIAFKNGLQEGGSVSTIFKLGDDLRQDALTIQTIRVIEKWWLKDGLDMRILTFSCVPTGLKQGMVEMVTNAETLCKIQAEHGVTGVFRDSAIAEWLAKMNPSTLDYRRAIDNFTVSCAAYCVVTYILGICDRHNDNIMLTKKGHLFHIDFGKFLGDAQMFGTFKRDRTPFVLTSDMVYVINDGEKGSLRFHRFVELCCMAFRIIRRNGNSLLNLFALMATAGIPGVDLNSVSYIECALLPECSNVEAAARFTRFIEESSGNWFTPVNFFLHSLAQMRFSSESNDDPTKLSFVPTIYTMEMDGRIDRALVVTFEKKYDPEKYYLYTIKIKRRTQTDWGFVHRTYKEFLEFHSKMCINFPMAVNTLKTLPKGAGLGRSNVKHVAEKRKIHLQSFLESLFSLADEVSHSNLVYTFFHPLLRDEKQHLGEEFERKSNARASLKKNPARIHGQLKLSLEYQRGALLVLVLHAVDLACPNNQPPSPYVKVYLQPDSSRVTKRKTRVVRRSQHPTFMEMIEYRLPLEIIRQKTLQVSVWHHDPLQENNFLGGVSIKLSTVALDRETTDTYVLGNITSSA